GHGSVFRNDRWSQSFEAHARRRLYSANGSSVLGGIMSGSFLLSSSVFWRREIVRFLRQRSRIVGALGTPVIFWLLLGFGVGDSFSPAGQSLTMRYQEYFFPGTVVLILLITAIFSTISI